MSLLGIDLWSKWHQPHPLSAPTVTRVIEAERSRSWWALLSSRSLIVHKHLWGAWNTWGIVKEKWIGPSLCPGRDRVRWPPNYSPVKSTTGNVETHCWWVQRRSPARTCFSRCGPALHLWDRPGVGFWATTQTSESLGVRHRNQHFAKFPGWLTIQEPLIPGRIREGSW